MHNFIQKPRNTLKAENAIYAQLFRFLALFQTPYFPRLARSKHAQQYSKGTVCLDLANKVVHNQIKSFTSFVGSLHICLCAIG